MEVDSNLVEEFKQLTKENVEFTKKCAKLAQDINSGQLTFIQLVEHLGGLLVNTSPTNRELGIWILTQVLERLPPDHFDHKQLTFICAFYTDRLKDHHQVIPAVLKGIIALTRFEQFPEGVSTQILTALFQNVACQQQQQNDRQNIYTIFEILLEKHATEICKMGLDYVYGVITAVDGERDPKSLIQLFNWYPKFLKTVNLGHLAEETFEILACYFPVDFKAPPQDPNTITRDKLAEALAPCLTAIPQFAEFCFPLALEKLDSSLEIAKIDSLKLLETGCICFDTASYIQYATKIWSQVQKELFNNPKLEVETACLVTLTAVINKISTDPNLSCTVKDISDTIKRNLIPDSKLFEPSWKLLLSVARASGDSCRLIVKDIAPILINTFNITTTPGPKMAVLTVLVKFFDCCARLLDQVDDELSKVPLLCLKGALDENNGLKKVGFEGLTQIAQFIPSDVRISFYDNFGLLLIIPQTREVRSAMLSCFDEFAKNYPDETKQKFVDVMEPPDIHSLDMFLGALCVLAPQDYFVNSTIDILIHYLNKESNFGQVSVNSLKNLLEKHENVDSIQRVLSQKDTINILVDWCINNTNIETKTLENISFILKSIIGRQSSDQQRLLVDKQLPKIDISKKNHLYLLDGILSRLQRDVEIDYNILNSLTDIVLKENSDFVRDVAAQLIANLINKCTNERVLQDYLEQFDDNFTNFTILAWVTKALVMRNHEKANIWIDRLLELLKYDKDIAGTFRIIANDNIDALSRKSHCIRTLLYQQKFFVVVSNKLNDNYQQEFRSYLSALGYLLEHTPRQAILLQFKKILKLIILCLDESEESEVLIVILRIIRDFISKKEQCIEDHLQEFLTRLLKLATFDKSMRVRLLALGCLQDYTSSFPTYKLLPHRVEVLKILGKVVDDKKRIVRREAVEARLLWFLLDAPM